MSGQKLEQSQELKQVLRLNPHQMALGRYLEMSAPELEEAVRRAVDDNPALKVDEDAAMLPGEGVREDNNEGDVVEREYDSDFFPSRIKSAFFEPASPPAGDSLTDNLNAQLAELDLSDRQRSIARYIIGNLDPDGYLRRTPSALADDLTASEGEEYFTEEVERALDVVKHLDPPGIGAADLRECLALQLKAVNNPDETTSQALTVVTRHFDALSKKHYDRLEARTGLSRMHLKEVLERIRALNPRPGASFETVRPDDRLSHIVPDFYVVPRDEDGSRFDITVLNASPHLEIEDSFRTDTPLIASSDRDATLFIKRKSEEAGDFIRLLEARTRTLSAVIKALVKIQHRFFVSDNPVYIVPMVLKDIAEMTGYSLSMISRAMSGKYVATPSGIYPVKMFFNEKPRENDEVLTREVIGNAIRHAIEGENPDQPLSDDALTAVLAGQGLKIARRTVAKHREKLGFPVARLRKKI